MDKEKLIPDILIGAVAAAGPIDKGWKTRVTEAIPHVAALISEGGRSWKIAEEMLDASVFEATFKSMKFEESSQRWEVMIDTGRPSENYPDGIEPIRTHRIDNPQGRIMAERLKDLKPGDQFFIWKVMEAMAGSSTKKVRVLVHFEKRYSSGANRVTPSAPEESQPPPPDDPPPVDTSPLSDSIDSERLVGWRTAAKGLLTAAQMKAVIDELKAKGYSFDGVSEIEWDEIVRPIIRRVRAGG